jgi:hypothetical protein
MAGIVRIMKIALNVMETYDVHKITALRAIYNFRVCFILEK